MLFVIARPFFMSLRGDAVPVAISFYINVRLLHYVRNDGYFLSSRGQKAVAISKDCFGYASQWLL